jgi:hypothetical protein
VLVDDNIRLGLYSDLTTGWTIGVRIPAGAGNNSLRHRVQTASGAHPPSRESFSGGKAAGE